MKRIIGIFAPLAIAILGCRFDGTGTKMQWAPDMADAPTVKSQESYLDPPPGSVAMSGVLYPATAEETAEKIAMPEDLAQDPDGRYLEQGKVLYNTFCIPCHGADARGHGLVNHPAIAPPDITSADYHAKKDGFFFFRITFGTSVMPSYGHAISVNERWMIIKHLRTLQH